MNIEKSSVALEVNTRIYHDFNEGGIHQDMRDTTYPRGNINFCIH